MNDRVGGVLRNLNEWFGGGESRRFDQSVGGGSESSAGWELKEFLNFHESLGKYGRVDVSVSTGRVDGHT